MLKKAIKNKKRAFKNEGTLSSYKSYQEYKNICEKINQDSKNERLIVKESKTNPKSLFKYINSKNIRFVCMKASYMISQGW